MKLQFSGRIWYWRGPAPFYFVTVPPQEAQALKAVANAVTYGWGMIPVDVQIGDVKWSTSLWPKDGSYIVPLKSHIRMGLGLFEGDEVTVRLAVELPEQRNAGQPVSTRPRGLLGSWEE